VREKVRVDSKWRIVIPRRFRRKIRVGDVLIVVADG